MKRDMFSGHQQVGELKQAIAKITGRLPVSNDPEYLARRLSGLRRRKVDGERAVDRYSDATTVLSVSMPGAAKDATTRIAGGEHVGISELVRRAIAEYAARHGYQAEVSHFEADR